MTFADMLDERGMRQSQIARAAEIGGAAAIRCQGLSDISAIKGRVDVPVIGLWKEGHEGVYITPSLRHARACVMAGSDIVALDATGRPRLDGLSFAQTVAALREDGTLVMADCGSFEDAQRAVDAGVDIVSTTLAGYTGDRVKTDGPDLELLREVVTAWRQHSVREVIVAVQVIVAPTQAEADALAQKVEVWGVELVNGQRVTVASEEQAYAFARQAGSDPVRIARRAQSLLAGTADSVLEQLNALHQQWGIDEFIIDTPVADGATRVQSLRLLAEARFNREVTV